MMLRPALLALALPLLAGCNAASGPAVGSAALPSGSGCAAEIRRFDAVLAADLESGNVAAKVHEQIQRELQPVRAACASGQDGGAIAGTGAIKRRHGYPG
jgi:hypothetical protein